MVSDMAALGNEELETFLRVATPIGVQFELIVTIKEIAVIGPKESQVCKERD
jgi:hypothetical protein